MVGLARLLPGLRAMVPVIAGISRVPPLPVMLPTVLVASVWYGLIAWLGAQAGSDLERAAALLQDVGGMLTVAAMGAAALIAWGWWRLRHRPDEGGPESDQGPASSSSSSR